VKKNGREEIKKIARNRIRRVQSRQKEKKKTKDKKMECKISGRLHHRKYT
jgi:hypothetical protein